MPGSVEYPDRDKTVVPEHTLELGLHEAVPDGGTPFIDIAVVDEVDDNPLFAQVDMQ
jgi:hypothetical protein